MISTLVQFQIILQMLYDDSHSSAFIGQLNFTLDVHFCIIQKFLSVRASFQFILHLILIRLYSKNDRNLYILLLISKLSVLIALDTQLINDFSIIHSLHIPLSLQLRDNSCCVFAVDIYQSSLYMYMYQCMYRTLIKQYTIIQIYFLCMFILL